MQSKPFRQLLMLSIGCWTSLCGALDLHDNDNCCLPNQYSAIARNTEYSFEIDDHAKPKWEIETLLPLYQTPSSLRHTCFLQGRTAHRASDDTYNIGLGYRYLSCKQNWLLGINSFFDSTRKHKHQRVGVGIEAMVEQFTLRGNYYHPTTGKMTTEKYGNTKITEEALRGYDGELETPFPYLPWMRLAFRGYQWEGDHFSNIHGFKGTIYMNITDNLSLELGRSIDNKFHNNYAKFSFTIGKPCEREYTLAKTCFSRKALPKRNLARWTLAKVKRHNDIVIERVTHGVTTGGVIIGRGD